MNQDKVYVFRLKPGDDLLNEIKKIVNEKNILAGWVITCVGSLTEYNIRFANRSNGNNDSGYFEIVSLTGTVSVNGNHLHLCICDSDGNAIGGHLLERCKIYTTAEIVIGTSSELDFKRENDGTTGWKELQIKEK